MGTSKRTIERVLVNSWAVVKDLLRAQGFVGVFHPTCLCTDVGKVATVRHLACRVKCQKVN